ncbi:unnamed protein product [Prorocentrum cordatum]|uniref:ATP-dependent RNA helicase n=1 Tax=Prorocentrum cordatum TaxID=2364126 RepID=A0ABN9XXV3_9DINO|nr:unnamed protein product [Polarella glacialis]
MPHLNRGVDVAVCNPGRLIDLVRKKATNLRRVTFLAMDEADRMVSHGFEPQVRSVLSAVRPARQTLLFSATMPARAARVAAELLRRPVWVTSGGAGQTPSNVQERVVVVEDEEAKWRWLAGELPRLASTGQVLVFAGTRAAAERLATSLAAAAAGAVAVLHGDLPQAARDGELGRLRRGEVAVLVATDVAGRGLDVPAVRTVISYDVAQDRERHLHRVGRTGRADAAQGAAYALVERGNAAGASMLCRHLRLCGVPAPPQLLRAARGREAESAGAPFEGPEAKRPRAQPPG